MKEPAAVTPIWRIAIGGTGNDGCYDKKGNQCSILELAACG